MSPTLGAPQPKTSRQPIRCPRRHTRVHGPTMARTTSLPRTSTSSTNSTNSTNGTNRPGMVRRHRRGRMQKPFLMATSVARQRHIDPSPPTTLRTRSRPATVLPCTAHQWRRPRSPKSTFTSTLLAAAAAGMDSGSRSGRICPATSTASILDTAAATRGSPWRQISRGPGHSTCP